jgi:phage terminase large subunit-like protein
VSGDLLELAALAHHWDAWARPRQLPPDTSWLSWGFVAARGLGKTRSCSEFVVREVMGGRARRIGFCSFTLDEAERTLVNGQSGLRAVSPPWFQPEFVKGVLTWPNGAIATPFTPEVPDGPRGPEHDLFWCSEVAAWGHSTREEFFKNVREGLRLGLGRMVFDTTPRARNPLIRYLLERSRLRPREHIVIRGATRENADNLTAGFAAELEAEYGSTQRGRQELLGEFFDDAEGALFRQEWIEAHRRDLPTVLARRVLAVDPAISTRRGTDATGIVDLGLGVDGQAYVIADRTDRYAPSAWAQIVVDLYFDGRCDCVVVERNRGGDLVAEILRAYAAQRGMRVEVVNADAVTRHVSGTIYVKEVHARRSKEIRAEPVATAVERGRVSFVRGDSLADLEDLLTTWIPGQGESPNALDAMVHGLTEILGLGREAKPDGAAAVKAAASLQAAIATTPQRSPNVARLLGGGRGGDRI